MADSPQPQLGLTDRWRSYGSRPPVARWTSRVSLLVGVAIGVALLLTLAAVIVRGLMWVWAALW